MFRSPLMVSLMLSALAGAAFEAKAIESETQAVRVPLDRLQTFAPSAKVDTVGGLVVPALYAQATPQTVQVERGGAQIYTQPEGNSQVIGEYRAGVVLSPRFRLFNPEGQAWLRVGDHWIAEESVIVLEGETAAAPSSKRPIPIDLPTPASAAAPPAAAPQSGGAQQPATPPSLPATAQPEPKPQSQPKPQPTAAKVKPQPKPQPTAAKAKPQAKPQPTAAKSSGSKNAVLITKDPEAQVNVRTASNLQSDVIHAGNAGDSVQIVKSQPGEGGYTWYQVKFPVAKVQGWVRGDFIKLGAQ